MITLATRWSGIRLAAAVLAAAAACGGDDDTGDDDAGEVPGYEPGVYDDHDLFAARCASPRTDRPDLPGSFDDEKMWLRSWVHDLYLWYSEVPDEDPALYGTPLDYFDVLKTSATTPSGRPKDQFHFTYDTDEWEALSQGGVSAGYGVVWIITSSQPPREVVAAYTQPDSPATEAEIARGARVISVDGEPVADSNDVDTLNAGLFPSEVGATHTLEIQDLDSDQIRTVELTSADVANVPVQAVQTIATDDGPVGYMLFNDHLANAEAALIGAVDQLAQEGITDLVVDLRYNGGGLLAIASELAYMVAGPVTKGQAFEETVFNDRYPETSPFDGQPIEPLPFLSQAVGFSAMEGAPLPSLNLERLYVLTGPGTCSASESLMNGLRGIDFEVIQIGETTCGKPYGFFPQDNCGTTYFSIQFQAVNQKGFGDYADGFTPGAEEDPAVLPGCIVPDDFTHQLGDPAEARLAAALAYRADGTCPAAPRATRSRMSAIDGQVMKPPWQQNRIYSRSPAPASRR